MNERPGNVTALLWTLIIVGLLGVLGNSLSAVGAAASGTMIELAEQAQAPAFSEIEGVDSEAAEALLAGQREMMSEVAAVARRTRPFTLALGVLGLAVSSLLVWAAYRGLRGGASGMLLRRALWVAGLWSVLRFGGHAWLQQMQAAATGDQMGRMLELSAEASGEAMPLDVAGLQQGMLAVTLAFSALVMVAKFMLYGYGLWLGRQPAAKAWLEEGVGAQEAEQTAAISG